jgi:hypothetical protein
LCLGYGVVSQDVKDLKNYHQEKETQSISFTLVVWNFFKGKKKLDLFESSVCMCVCMCACGEQELFLEKFVEDAFDRMQESHRNSITYSDLSSHVVSTERLEFLSDFVPEKVLVSSILPSKALMEN